MLRPLCPAEAYRRMELDAWIAGGDHRQLTSICLVEAVGALDRALLWHERGSPARRDRAVYRALACVQALRLGVDRAQPLGGALLILYGHAAARLVAATRSFQRDAVASTRQDLADLDQAFAALA